MNNKLIKYLEDTKKLFSNNKVTHQYKFYDWFLTNAKSVQCKELTGKDKDYVDKIIQLAKLSIKNFPVIKQCFFNALILNMLSNSKIKYVEGFYHTLIPAEHGWCEINGKHFDPTQQYNGFDVEKNFYYGMIFDHKDIERFAIRTEGKDNVMSSILISKYKEIQENAKQN